MKQHLMRRMAWLTAVMLVSTTFVVATYASTNGYLLNCYCARSFARGGTLIALPDNGAVLLTNPAGLAFLPQRNLGIGLGVLIPKVKFQNSVNSLTSADQKYYPMPFTGYVDPMPGSKWAWGFGLNVVGGMGADYNLYNPLFRDENGNLVAQDYYSNFGYMKVGPGVAYQLRDNLSVGAGVQLYYGMLDFRMPFTVDPVATLKGTADPSTGATFGQLFAADPAQGGFGYTELTAYAAMNDLDGFGVGANFGVYWKVNDVLSLGFAYSSPSRIHFKGVATMDMGAQFNDAFARAVQGVMTQNPGLSQEQAQAMVVQMFGSMGIDVSKGVAATFGHTKADFDVPQKLAFGIGLHPSERWMFGLDLEWIDWSSAFDKFPLKLNGSSNDNINLMLNGDVSDGHFNYDFPLNWRDSYNVKFGVDYQLLERTRVRAGFIHGRNPVPSNTVFAIFPAIVENHLTLGFGQSFKRFDLDVAYIRAFTKSQKAVVTGHLLGSEYNGSLDKLNENLIMTSVMFKF